MFSKLTTVVLGVCLLSGAAVGIKRFQSEDMMFMPGKTAAYVSTVNEDGEEAIMSSEEALKIALAHANLNEVEMEKHEIHQTHSIPFDTDVYEIEIWTMEKDYTFTIEAVDGRVLDYEVKDIYYQDTQD